MLTHEPNSMSVRKISMHGLDFKSPDRVLIGSLASYEINHLWMLNTVASVLIKD